MTDNRSPRETRAIEIVAAYGADPQRWPEAERDAVLAVAGQPPVAAALAEARALDALLGDWARADVAAAPYDAAALVPPTAAVPNAVPARRGWLAAAAAAAALAAVVAFAPMAGVVPDAAAPRIAMTSPQATVPSATATGEDGSDAAFAYVFTPTVDEDALI